MPGVALLVFRELMEAALIVFPVQGNLLPAWGTQILDTS